MKTVAAVVLAALTLGGCVVAPAYPDAAYYPAPAYGYYSGPSVGIYYGGGYYGGGYRSHHRHWR